MAYQTPVPKNQPPMYFYIYNSLPNKEVPAQVCFYQAAFQPFCSPLSPWGETVQCVFSEIFILGVLFLDSPSEPPLTALTGQLPQPALFYLDTASKDFYLLYPAPCRDGALCNGLFCFLDISFYSFLHWNMPWFHLIFHNIFYHLLHFRFYNHW